MLIAENLQVSYGEVQALWDVSFHVEEGEIVTLVGANGAGKTTTLKAISGLLKPKTGTVSFQGGTLNGLPPHAIVELGIIHIPEGRQLWPGMSVLENLELGAYTPRARAHRQESLQRVFALFPRLKERRRQRADTLSGGEQQMCAIARALMGLPKLLMLDEPSLGLAPMLVEEVFATVRGVAREGMTVLLVEQNINQALRVANRGYVLETGRIVLEGSGQELLESDHVRRSYLGVA